VPDSLPAPLRPSPRTQPMHLSQILTSETISLANTASSKKKVLEEASSLLSGGSRDTPEEAIYERLLERERLGSTGVGHGVALPHARIKGLSAPRGAFLQLTEGADFDAIDNAPVDLVFALIVPEETTQEHLQLLALLAAVFSNAALRDKLRHSASSNEIPDLFDQTELAQSSA